MASAAFGRPGGPGARHLNRAGRSRRGPHGGHPGPAVHGAGRDLFLARAAGSAGVVWHPLRTVPRDRIRHPLYAGTGGSQSAGCVVATTSDFGSATGRVYIGPGVYCGRGGGAGRAALLVPRARVRQPFQRRICRTPALRGGKRVGHATRNAGRRAAAQRVPLSASVRGAGRGVSVADRTLAVGCPRHVGRRPRRLPPAVCGTANP